MNAKTLTSVTSGTMRTSGTNSRGRAANSRRTPAPTVTDEIRNPSAAAGRASSRLSVSNCLMRRPRDAPSERQMPISRCRARPRASIMFATLAHARTSTSPNATMIGAKIRMVSPASGIAVSRETIETPVARSLSGRSVMVARDHATSAAFAPSMLTPSRRRPITPSGAGLAGSKGSGRPSAAGMVMGSQRSLARDSRPPNPSRATPTTTSGTPRITTVLPTTEESPPNRPLQAE